MNQKDSNNVNKHSIGEGAATARVKHRLKGMLTTMQNKANEEFAKRQAVRLAAAPAATTLITAGYLFEF